MDVEAPYSIERKLCTGSFAEVFCGEFEGRRVAIKVPRKDKHNSDKAAERELKILQMLSHQNISKLVGSTYEDGHVVIFTELMDGDLRSLISEDELSTFDRIDIALQLSHGLAFMHEKGFVHQDIKLDNVLYRRRQVPLPTGSRFEVQLCDFGLSRCARGPFTNSTRLGTPVYMPPEVLRGNMTLTKSVDVYSYAIALWELFSGKVAYSAYTKFALLRQDVVMRKMRPQLPGDIPQRMRELISACWHAEASCRPQAHSIVAEMSSICSDALVNDADACIGFLASPSTGSPYGFYGI